MFEQAVKEIEIFKGLTPKQVNELFSWLQRREYAAGTVIFKENRLPNGLYVLVGGTVSVLKETGSGRLKLTEIEAPSFFGEMGLLNGKQRTAAVRAQTNVISGLLATELFVRKLEENNLTALRIALNVGRLLAKRLGDTSNKLTTQTALIARHMPR
jgi:CRP-like cAMP-binding protein